MPYQTGGWWPTSCTNQPTKALVPQNCQQENTRKRSPLSSQYNQTTRIMVVRIPKCQASTRNGLMSRMPTRTRRGVQSVEILLMWKAFNAPQKFWCKACHQFGPFTSLCYQKKQAPFKSRKPKAHQLQAGQYMQKKVPYAVNLKITAEARIPFAHRSKCSAH